MSDDCTMVDIPRGDLVGRLSPVDSALLAAEGLSMDKITLVELSYGSELAELVTSFAAKHVVHATSFTLDIGRGGGGCCGDIDEGAKRGVNVRLGLGLHRFDYNGATLYVLRQTLGKPVGTDCGAALYQNLVLISPAPADVETLRSMCQTLVQEADRVEPHSFTVWRWHTQYHRWMRGQVVTARSVESVVLPKATQEQLIDDIDEFFSSGTRDFYRSHGIPHKRSYCFHGAPGAGKTSTIQALAGRYQRNVCYLCPAHPDMTDDMLKSAIEHVPHKCIIVLEDVDALFGEKRAKKDGDKSALTFSGLLNALDGVGSGTAGQIFVLTTNHRDRLDPALIRNGRVDVHIEFTDAVPEQMRGLFLQFYPNADEGLAAKFEKALIEKLDGKSVSMAGLQHFFIQMRKKTAEEAIAEVGKVVQEMEGRANAKAEEKAKEAESDKEKAAEGEDKGKDKGESAADEKAVATGAAGETHVHVHLHK